MNGKWFIFGKIRRNTSKGKQGNKHINTGY